uniref:Uncharacterized protein n=1 Tax=Glossina morsitans morsitans TaxID=37546 RepID=A0A1B0G9U9_GLOMM
MDLESTRVKSSTSEQELGDLEQIRLKYVVFDDKADKNYSELSLVEVRYFEAKHETDIAKNVINNETPEDYNCHVDLKKEINGGAQVISEELMDVEEEGHQCQEEALHDVIEKNYHGQSEPNQGQSAPNQVRLSNCVAFVVLGGCWCCYYKILFTLRGYLALLALRV